MSALTAKQELFAQRVVIHGDSAADAYRAAYDVSRMVDASVWRKAAELMANGKVTARIKELRGTAQERTAWDVTRVLNHLADIATADPSELIRPERRCCRRCHGVGFAYQWQDEEEWATAVARAMDAAAPGEEPKLPSDEGGYGFRINAQPHPDCPHCAGEGYEHIHLVDIRNVKGPARRLYAGVKKSKDGLQVLMRDQDAALVNIAKIIGAFAPEKHELTGKDGAPIEGATVVTMDPNAATDLYRKLVGR
jgi:phage terminase small subunit